MKNLLFSLILVCVSNFVVAQDFTFKHTSTSQQLRSVFTISQVQLGTFSGNEIKKAKIGFRLAIGLGAAIEIASQWSVTTFRNDNHSDLKALHWAFRPRFFVGKEIFPWKLPTYWSGTVFGAIYSRSGSHMMSYYTQYKSSEKALSFSAGTVHRLSRKLSLTLDVIASVRKPSRLTAKDIKQKATGLLLKGGMGVIYYF